MEHVRFKSRPGSARHRNQRQKLSCGGSNLFRVGTDGLLDGKFNCFVQSKHVLSEGSKISAHDGFER